jgi:hypothetical protein
MNKYLKYKMTSIISGQSILTDSEGNQHIFNAQIEYSDDFVRLRVDDNRNSLHNCSKIVNAIHSKSELKLILDVRFDEKYNNIVTFNYSKQCVNWREFQQTMISTGNRSSLNEYLNNKFL